MAACLLAEGRHELANVPRIADVDTMAEVLAALGATVERRPDGMLVVDSPAPAALVPEAPYDLVERMRASIVVLGPLLARCGHARVSMPGGDDFGDRPIDFHLHGLGAMGARFETAHGYVEGVVDGGPSGATRLVGTRVVLEYPSHTATDNLLMAAVLAKGTTVIENAAREPEVCDLANFLNSMGAASGGPGRRGSRSRGSRRSSRPATRSSPTASSSPPTWPRSVSPAARSSSRTPGSSTSRCCCAR